MSNTKSTRRALIMSALSIILCFAMLLGTTYAWFTDTVASAGNIIRSGILDADLVDADGNSLAGKPLQFQKAAGAPADEKVLWEPGCTYNLEEFKVINKGNLAFKFKIIITGIEGDYKLLEVIDWTISYGDNSEDLDLNQWYHLKPGETFPSENGLGVVLSGHMREEAGNEYQDLVAEGISIMIYAIQDTVEFDSFDNQYDAMAQVPTAKVSYINGNGIKMFGADQRNDIVNYMNADTEEKKEAALANATAYDLDSAYRFSADDYDEDSAYTDWHADFVVSVDKPITAPDSVLLAGQYGSPLWGEFPWIYFTNGSDTIDAGVEIRLLELAGLTVSYEEVLAFRNFQCGIKDLTGDNAGTTVTVELRIYEATGGSLSTETGEYISLGVTEYTFGEKETAATVEDLKDAFAQGGTITLVDDVITNEKLTVLAGANVTLDLNGHTIAGAFDNAGASAIIENKGNLTITNGTIVSLAEYPDVDWGTEGFPTYATNTIVNRGTLVIGEGAYIENKTNAGGASYAIDNYAGGDVTINGGIIRAKDVAIRQFTSSTTAENNVTINGGYILGKRAVWVQIASSDPSKAPLANLTVNGGTLASNVIDGSGNVIYSYSYGNSFANTVITITGGEFLDGQVAFGGGYKGDIETVTITGGTFDQDVIRWLADGSSELILAANN